MISLPMLSVLIHILAQNQPVHPELARMGLVPRPKSVQLLGSATIGPDFHLSPDFPLARWLADVLSHVFGWRSSNTGFPVRYLRQPLQQSREAYRLELSEAGARVIYAEESGAFRGTATLIRILTSYAAEFDGRRLTVPALRVSDWPDVPLRGVHLQMAFGVNEGSVRQTVEAMARLGYNMVGFEVGGRFEFRSHPECAQSPYWTRQQIRSLVELAKSRGMTPVPCINAINHCERSPQVFVIPHSEWQRRVMDLANPRFYEVFFDLLDELVEAFGHPPFMHIGTDECNAALRELVAKRGGAADEYYAQFVNRVADHLRSLGVRAVIWHDMLLKEGEHRGEPANADDDVPTHRALDKLDRRVIVDYWCYGSSDYRGLRLFRELGFETWVSPWYDRRGVAELCWAGQRAGASGVLGTTWSDPSEVAKAIVLTADHAWNAARHGEWEEYEPWALANLLYSGRPCWAGGAQAKNIRLEADAALPDSLRQRLLDAGVPLGRRKSWCGVLFDLSNPLLFRTPHIRALSSPAEIIGAHERGEKIYVATQRGQYLSVDGVNKPRGAKETILYVRAPGWTSTRTNEWGREWVISDGKVTDIRDGQQVGGDSSIPENGYVISAHMYPQPSGYEFLSENLKLGDSVTLMAASSAQPPQSVSAELSSARGVAVIMNAVGSLATSYDEPLVSLTVETDAGNRYSLSCSRSSDLSGLSSGERVYPPERGQGWRAWPAYSSCERDSPLTLVAYEWSAQGGERATRLEVSVTPLGLAHGILVLAAAAW
ncbi:MAG: family 20 glycosylhydrolase [Armatimonadetes bacterium]|nr:family 20 glycosylhydrolase [Armatimonadota bacterium]